MPEIVVGAEPFTLMTTYGSQVEFAAAVFAWAGVRDAVHERSLENERDAWSFAKGTREAVVGLAETAEELKRILARTETLLGQLPPAYGRYYRGCARLTAGDAS